MDIHGNPHHTYTHPPHIPTPGAPSKGFLQQESLGAKIFRLSFFFDGFVLLMIAMFIYNSQADFVKKSLEVPGTVLSNESLTSVDDDGDPVYAPVVSFTARDGRKVEFESGVQSDPPEYQVGDTVQVLYDPNDPSNAQINNPFELYLAAYIVGGLGVIFLFIGLIVYFRSRS